MWFAAAGGLAFWVAKGGLNQGSVADWLYGLGQAIGIVTAVAMMTQLLLASRAPYIEGVLGHDKAIARHTVVGKVALVLMVVHLTLITGVDASRSGESFVAQYVALGQSDIWLAGSTIAGLLFVIVLVTSFTAHMRRWRYESWHLVHRLVYVAIAFAIPHQFFDGGTFLGGGPASYYWLVLYVIAVGSFVIFRMLRPLWLWLRHAPRVSSVARHADGSTTLEIRGSSLGRLEAKAGQFFLWRFYTRKLMWQKHPYSLSRAPSGDTLRITVRPSGKGSAAVGTVNVGTRVGLEGPLGVFTHTSRVGHGLVLISAGIGITPIRAMLETVEAGEPCTVIIRARSRDDAPLLDEVESLAVDKGARLIVLFGPRGRSWGPAEGSHELKGLVPDVATADVFICGPVAWASQVEADALGVGVPKEAIHRERFGW